jgi:GAF domain-containing protein
LWTILRAAIAITNADRGNVQVVEQNGGLRIAAQSGFDRAFLDHFGLVDSDACACGTAMNAGQRVVVADVEHSPIFSGASRAAMLDADARAVQSTPVLDRTGRVIAMVSTHFRVPHQPTPDQLQLLDILVRAAALALRVGA